MKSSIVMRVKNERAALPKTLDRLFSQEERDFEVLAVDSGSTDGGDGLLAERGVRVIRLPAGEFTYGRALNVGCREARGELLVFLSAHAVPRSDRWLGELTAPLEADGMLAGVSGSENGRVPGLPGLRSPLRFDREAYLRNPYAGLCNSNAAIRRSLWERFPFDERLTGAEDKEWTLRLLTAGYRVMLLPGADVEHHHAEGLRQAYRRGFREHLAFRAFGAPIGGYGLHRLLMEVLGAPVCSLGGELREWPRYLARCWGKYRALSGAKPPENLYGR